MFESLESRRLLAVAVNASAGVLVINGDNKANLINVTENLGSVHVETSTLPNGTITQQDFTGITQIKISGGAGADSIFYTGNSVGADIHGDTAVTGPAASVSSKNNNNCNKGGSGKKNNGGSSGGSGDGNGGGNAGAAGGDSISVDDEGTGSSTLDGDGGADSLTVIRGHNTQAFGGDGNDQFFLDTSGDPTSTIVARGEAGADSFTTYGGSNTIFGDAGNDKFFDFGGTNTVTL